MKIKYLNYLLTGLLILIFSMKSAAQTYRELKIGDPVPDYTLKNLINSIHPTMKLADFKGKLLIIDFWTTGCVSCVESWPKLMALQKQFGSRIKIILVNPTQDLTKVKAFVKRRNSLSKKELTLPSVCRDTLLANQLFKVYSVPHVVWIDQSGILQSITTSGPLNEKNINAFLNGYRPLMPQKKGFNIKYNPLNPSLLSSTFTDGISLVKQSVLTRYVDGLYYSIGSNSKNDTSVIYAINVPAIDLYKIAYSEKMDLTGRSMLRLLSNRIKLATSDTARFTSEDRVDKSNIFSYQAYSVGQDIASLKESMHRELNHSFNTKTKWELSKRQCLVFSLEDSTKLRYQRGKNKFIISDAEFKVNNVSMFKIVGFLEQSYYFNSPYQIIDETGFLGKVGEINIEGNVTDFKVLDSALKYYGLRFRLEERMVKTLVISDLVQDSGKYLPFN